MSGRPHCKSTGKVRFRTEHDALDLLDIRRDHHRGERRAFECKDCAGWHLTSWDSVHVPPQQRRVIDLRGPVPTPREFAEALGLVPVLEAAG